jgi:hypothetical protein
LLSDCEVPIELAELVRIDLRLAEHQEAAFSKLIERLLVGGRTTISEVDNRVRNLFKNAADWSGPGFNLSRRPEYDDIYSYLAALDLTRPETEGLALHAFKIAHSTLATIDPRYAYRHILVLAETLAVLIHAAPEYHKVAQSFVSDWGDRGLVGPTTAMRAYSKLAEARPELVNASSILQCVDRFNGAPRGIHENNVFFHLVRCVCKMLYAPPEKISLKL